MSESPYIYSFDVDDGSTAACVVQNVGTKKYVLELGCAYGVMTKVLVEHNNCRVFGVEYDEKSAEYAKEYCEDLVVVDIESADLKQIFGDKRFDVIVAADVLEHLRKPEKCLVSLSKYLAPNGYIVISIPNVAYSGIIAELLNNDFRYRETGLLDSTHLRFWGLQGIKQFLKQAGFIINNLERTELEPKLSEFAEVWESLPAWLADILGAKPEGNVYQFIIKAAPVGNLEQNKVINSPEMLGFSAPYAELDRQYKQQIKVKSEQEIASLTEKINLLTEQVNLFNISFSWKVTRPFRFVGRLVRYVFCSEKQQLISQAIRKSYHLLPIPVLIKRCISFFYHNVIKKGISILRRKFLRAKQFQTPSIKPAAQLTGLDDYIFWGVVDWHFRYQRPQQLAQALVDTGRRVIYISPVLVDEDRAGFDVEALDGSGALFQVKLYAKGAPSIYTSVPALDTMEQLRKSIGEVLIWSNSMRKIALIQHPYWYDIASAIPNRKLVYDCMDHHEGFGTTTESLVQLEQKLLMQSDLTIATSSWLHDTVGKYCKNSALIRNAGEYEHFSMTPDNVYSDSQGRKIIGYYGAIADWFDLDLVESVAKQYSDCLVLLIGADTVNAKNRLVKQPNVIFIGEVSYNDLPYYLHSFDVCLLPFKVIPLTIATNPVKAYEYLSAGKPTICVDLPEMTQFEGLLYVASNHEDFVEKVGAALNDGSKELVLRRREFAAGQTWGHRIEELIKVVETSIYEPLVSVIVVTYNNLDLTKVCLASIDEHSLYDNLEIIVVDNASADGSKEFLQSWSAEGINRKRILNDENLGFAAANNQGLKAAIGDYLVMLNNDTCVTSGWVKTLFSHCQRDNSIGLIGPVTNNIGNEAKIDIQYKSMSDMHTEASSYTLCHVGQLYPLNTAAFFCVMISRDTFDLVGYLDEDFGRGFFEDDDYCRRIEKNGLRIVCAEDVFIHHNLSASFNKLNDKVRQELFEKNKKIYEKKWGAWMPHRYRSDVN